MPLVYRIHDALDPEKLRGLRDFLETLDISFLRPAPEAGSVQQDAGAAKELPVPDLVNEVMLRSQSQAEYTPRTSATSG